MIIIYNNYLDNANITESNLPLTLDRPKVNIKVISHAWYSKESPNEYETGESFTIQATLNNTATITAENKIKFVTSNTGLIYESDECTIDSTGNCSINVTISESANLGESSLAITSSNELEGTTKLEFKVVAGNIIFFTVNDQRQGNFASTLQDGESAGDITNQWCESYALNPESSPNLDTRYRNKHYKGMINGNPATISGKVYYRDDAKTKVATATGAYLAESLENSVLNTTSIPGGNSSPKEAWTGAEKGENCSSWTNNSSTNNLSHVGVIDTNTLKIAWWRSTRSRSCDANLGIYCVSQ